MYGKIFQSTYEGSLCGTGFKTFAVWAYAIVNADADGIVALHPGAMAAIFGESKADVEVAIAFLCQPDPESTNPDEDGRRMARESGIRYRIVNHAHYRKIRDDQARRDYERQKKQRYRAKLSASATCQSDSTEKREAESSKQKAEATSISRVHHQSEDMSLNVHGHVPSHANNAAMTVFDIWNEETAGKLPKANPTAERQKAVAEKLKNAPGWLEHFTQACRMVASDPFYLGNGSRGWKATIDHLLKADNAVKLAERVDQTKPSKPKRTVRDKLREQYVDFALRRVKAQPEDLGLMVDLIIAEQYGERRIYNAEKEEAEKRLFNEVAAKFHARRLAKEAAKQ